MCAYVYSYVCACLRVCTFCNTPSTSTEVGVAGFASPNIEKVPTPISQAAILGTPFETQHYFNFIP